MTPDEEPQQAAPEPSPAAPAKGVRRSRRGGRRHPRRHGPRLAAPQSAATVGMSEAPVAAGEIESAPERPPQSGPKQAAVSHAIDQVNQVIEELKRALDEMELVLETLELAERQKIDDEREIESLQRALRQLHRPRDGEQRRQ